jgi:hypothetical protein
MEEELKWQKKEQTTNPKLVDDLKSLIQQVVTTEINNINSKIESLCSMGVIKDTQKMQELRDKIKQLQTGQK